MPGLALVTPPAIEPVTLAEAKLYCRVDATLTGDDSLITDLIAAARRRCEDFQGRSYIQQTWDYFLDAFPQASGYVDEPICLPLQPISSVTSVKYTPYNAGVVTMSAADYFVDTATRRESRIVPNVGKVWPADLLRIANGVEVRFVSGYGAAAANVPEQIRQIIKQLVTYWYQNREAKDELPRAIENQLVESSGLQYA